MERAQPVPGTIGTRIVNDPSKARRMRQRQSILRVGIAIAVSIPSLGCSGELNDAQASNGCVSLQGTPPPLAPEPLDYDLHSAERAADSCKFASGADTRLTVGPDAPRPPDDFSVVVVMLENRSFDNYLNGVPETDYAVRPFVS